MKKSNEYINESVFDVNLKYVKLQNKTKELFFKCLDEGRDLDYFRKEARKIWGNLDHQFLKDAVEEYENIVHKENIKTLGEDIERQNNVFIKLVGLAVIIGVEKKFLEQKEKEYKKSIKSFGYKVDKDSYLKKKVQKYTNQIVPYYSKTTGKKVRDVQLSTYASMIHNTNLTRSGWNTTLNDAYEANEMYFYIPRHSFSCPHCAEYQSKIMSASEVMNHIGLDEEAEGDILHPNCKCVLAIWKDGMRLQPSKYNMYEIADQYEIRQKTNSLTLKKEQILSDIKIQKSLGNYDEVDKLNAQRNKINSQIRELKEQLPTKELQKQVTAINR